MDRARGAFAAGCSMLRAWHAWGAPVFDAQLVRNRHGPVGRWIMEWKCDECLFTEPAAYPQPVAAAPAHRPHQAAVQALRRSREQNSHDTNVRSLSRLRGRVGGVARADRVENAYQDPKRGEARPQRRRRQAAQRHCDLRPRRSGRALRPLDRPAACQCPRHLPRIDGVRRRRGRRPKDARRYRRLVRPFHAAGGAGSAARAVSGHHRLRPSVRRRTRAAADREWRAGTAGLYRQCRDRLDFDLRPHPDAADFRENHCRWRGGPGRQSAAGLRARRQ